MLGAIVSAMQSLSRCAALAALAALGTLPLAVLADGVSAAPEVALRQVTANVGGLWCGAGLLHEFTLGLARGQSFTRAVGGICSR